MRINGPRLGSLVLIFWALLHARGTTVAGDEPAPRAAADFFETSIRPLLAGTCQKCHGSQKQSSGLRLDSREAVLKGGDSGPGLVPGKPEESLLVQVVAQTHGELKMPPKGKLPEPAVAALRSWVEMGAPWGEASSPSTGSKLDHSAGHTHWAFDPLRAVVPPRVNDSRWIRTPVDSFVLARLEHEGLTPSPQADRRTLIRRATLDLLGIPPTAQEVEAFEADRSSLAFERVVDRLLSSPLYGERWGRHWLDVARYADTKGYVFQEDRKYPFAYTYRDYVIRAFNTDLPFNRFILHQLAADQLDLGGDPRPLAAMGFLTVGRRFLNDQNEIIDDRIDLVGRGLMGLSIGCARCHDHKYDPIPSEDYYSLYGVFASSVEPDELPSLDPPGTRPSPEAESLKADIDKARKSRDDFLATRRNELETDFRKRFSRYLKAAYDLDLNARHPGLDARAEADKLLPQRLRGAIFLWKRRLETADARKDPVLGPLRAFAELPNADFAAKASELVRGLPVTAPGKTGGAHPLIAGALTEHPPGSMVHVIATYIGLISNLESKSAAGAIADPQWESLRQAFVGPNGILTIPPDGARFVLSRQDRQKYTELGNAVKRLEAKSAGKAGRAMVMKDSPQPMDPRVFIRGNPGRPGKPVPRQFLKVLAGKDRRPFQKGSGRLELAQAIVDAKNPLTARVLVNRVWNWHFGQGLLTTPSDLGLRSDPPSHPELLDYLARAFIDGGWSIKSVHRQIVLSSTYLQQSELRPECQNRDPQNRWLWRFNRQRLDFEALRDSILAVSGSLERTTGGPPIAITDPPFPPRRTVYGFIDRQNMDDVYRTFDFAVPDATSPKRFVTTVPQQALFLMNSPFIQEQAKRLAESVTREQSPPGAPLDPVRALYRRVLGRSPEPRERTVASAFLVRGESDAAQFSSLAQLAQVLMLTNEFVFVD
jgi:hypothetical protein